MNGVLVIDKPAGMSSFDVLRVLKKRFPGVKMGHLGTLDPLATGVLVVFFGKATQLISYFSEAEKDYEVEGELGKTSDTYDVTGKIEVGASLTFPSSVEFEHQIKSFLGNCWQIQPPFSAIRFQGKRAYELAREGQKIDLGKRQVSFFELRLLSYEAPHFGLFVKCSSGTYVRSLIHELGEKTGCGAVMTALRRTRVGPFLLQEAHDPSKCSEGELIRAEQLLSERIDWKPRSQSEKNVLLKKFSSVQQKP